MVMDEKDMLALSEQENSRAAKGPRIQNILVIDKYLYDLCAIIQNFWWWISRNS